MLMKIPLPIVRWQMHSLQCNAGNNVKGNDV